MSKDVTARVLYNTKVSGHYLRLGLETGWSRFDPGQFVMVRVPDDRVFLRRPFSISRAIDDGIEVLYKVVGRGTERMSRLEEGDKVDIIGPQGRGFEVRSRGVRGPKSEVRSLKYGKIVLVAGGFGIAPFVGFADILAKKGVSTNLYYGGKCLEDILFLDEFGAKGVSCYISTEDGSLGHKGIVTELLSKDIHNYLKNSMIYCCGPAGLIEAVVWISKKHSIPAELSFETYMGCGIGVCLGCAVETVDGYKRACREGPVFRVEDLS